MCPTRMHLLLSLMAAGSSMSIYTAESWMRSWLSINSKPISAVRNFCRAPIPKSEIDRFTSAGHAGENARLRVLPAQLDGLLIAAAGKAKIPVVFATGYSTVDLPAPFDRSPLLLKPFRKSQLKQALLAALHPEPTC